MFSLQIVCPIEMIKDWEFLGADLLSHWEYFQCPKWTVITPTKSTFKMTYMAVIFSYSNDKKNDFPIDR